MFAAFFVEFWLTESKNHLGPFRFKSTFSLLASKKSIIVFFLIKSPVRTGAIESVMPQDARSSSVSQVSRCRYLIVRARENSELEVIWSPLSRERCYEMRERTAGKWLWNFSVASSEIGTHMRVVISCIFVRRFLGWESVHRRYSVCVD